MGKNAKKKRQEKFAQRQAAKAASGAGEVAKIAFVARPFEGMKHEADFVALRELLPAASLTLKTNKEYGSREFELVSLLPANAAAFVREDGRLLVASQTVANSPDISHDLAASVLAGLEAEPGNTVTVDFRQPGPRLQDILDESFQSELQIHKDFSFWFNPDEELDDQTKQALSQTAEEIVPATVIPGVDNMFHFRMNHDYVRWVCLEEVAELENALARLQGGQQLKLGEGSRFLGIFRALGVLVPVFEVPDGTDAEALTEPAQSLIKAIAKALKEDKPLTDAERRAKAGILSRQVSLR